ncbi:MAG TPA: hypothetical protein VE955_00345 [Candidatus Dormibacteraeota bacterium]|nr:hypothetical protein [Candidatus Dormibacteraeota bacterium]
MERWAGTSQEQEIRITAQNERLKCPKCAIAEQIILVGGHQSGRVECRVCGLVLWKGRQETAQHVEAQHVVA